MEGVLTSGRTAMTAKKLIISTMLLISLAAPAFAQNNDHKHEDKQAKEQQHFAERKARAEKNIRENIAREQERLSCIGSAHDDESFKSCFPPPKEHHDDCHH
jgi:hypothetical protein